MGAGAAAAGLTWVLTHSDAINDLAKDFLNLILIQMNPKTKVL